MKPRGFVRIRAATTGATRRFHVRKESHAWRYHAARRKDHGPLNDIADLTAVTPTRDDVSRRAYELYEQRGRGDGQDWDDWFQAERELRRVNAGATDVAA